MESCINFCVYFDKTQYTIALLKHILIIIFCQINCHYNKHSSNNFRTLRGFSITLGFILTYTLTHSLAWWENDPQWWWGVPTNWSSCFFALISIELWNFKDLLHEKPSSPEFFFFFVSRSSSHHHYFFLLYLQWHDCSLSVCLTEWLLFAPKKVMQKTFYLPLSARNSYSRHGWA